MMIMIALIAMGVLSVLVSVLVLDFVEERRSRREDRRRKLEGGR